MLEETSSLAGVMELEALAGCGTNCEVDARTEGGGGVGVDDPLDPTPFEAA
jgi:hypothetical protein